jgi:hypothetical protein
MARDGEDRVHLKLQVGKKGSFVEHNLLSSVLVAYSFLLFIFYKPGTDEIQ